MHEFRKGHYSVFSSHGVILGKKRLVFRRKNLPFLGRGSYVEFLDDKKFVEDFLSISRSSAKKCKLFSFGKQAFLAKDDEERGIVSREVHHPASQRDFDDSMQKVINL